MSRATEILNVLEIKMLNPKEFLKGKYISSDDHPNEYDFEWIGDRSLKALSVGIAKDIAGALKRQNFKYQLKGDTITDIKM